MYFNKITKIGLFCLFLAIWAGPVVGYELNNIGTAGGWDDINKGGSVTTVIDQSDLTGDLASDRVNISLSSAFSTWDNVGEASRLSIAVKEDAGENYDVFDGLGGTLDQGAHWRYANITVGGWLPENYFLSLDPNGANILAVTWTARLRGDGSGKPSWHSEIFFNDGWNWIDDAAAANADLASGLLGRLIDLETVALHEIGHSLGLNHENDVPSVMSSFYEGASRDLFEDDIFAISSVYSDVLSDGKKGQGGGRKGGPKKILSSDLDWYLGGFTTMDTVSSFLSHTDHISTPEPSTVGFLAIICVVSVSMRRQMPRRLEKQRNT